MKSFNKELDSCKYEEIGMVNYIENSQCSWENGNSSIFI